LRWLVARAKAYTLSLSIALDLHNQPLVDSSLRAIDGRA